MSLQAHLVHVSHYPISAGGSGKRHIYDSTRRKYYWPHMANDVYAIVRDCFESAQKRHVMYTDAPSSYILKVASWNLLQGISWYHFRRRDRSTSMYWK